MGGRRQLWRESLAAGPQAFASPLKPAPGRSPPRVRGKLWVEGRGQQHARPHRHHHLGPPLRLLRVQRAAEHHNAPAPPAPLVDPVEKLWRRSGLPCGRAWLHAHAPSEPHLLLGRQRVGGQRLHARARLEHGRGADEDGPERVRPAARAEGGGRIAV